MTYWEYRQILKADRNRYGKKISHLKLYVSNNGYKIVTHYRRCHWLSGCKLLKPFSLIQRLIYHKKCVRYGCDIPSHVTIGKGLKIDHPIGIVINSQAVIGENLTIKSGAVIGKTEKGVPVIGNHVMIGVHALVIGNVSVADNADIGAGAIVTHDVPESAVVICEAAHIQKIKAKP